MTHGYTLFLFYKNIFYKNIEAEICEILRYCKNKSEAEIVKGIQICKYNTMICFYLALLNYPFL